jgi:hypothetical protein
MNGTETGLISYCQHFKLYVGHVCTIVSPRKLTRLPIHASYMKRTVYAVLQRMASQILYSRHLVEQTIRYTDEAIGSYKCFSFLLFTISKKQE